MNADLESDTIRSASIDVLDQMLADTLDVRHQVLQARCASRCSDDRLWLPGMFDRVAAHIDRLVESLCDHMAQLGSSPLGSLQNAARRSRMPEYPGGLGRSADHAGALTRTLALLAVSMRGRSDLARAYGDDDTARLLAQAWRTLAVTMWQVRLLGPPEE